MKKMMVCILALACVLGGAQWAFAHCEIPCGIYTDDMRFTMMRENITTLEKSMNQIRSLSTEPAVNMNQLVRWVNNKEEHADNLSDIVTQYFLKQRVKPAKQGDEAGMEKYQKQLMGLHQIMIHSMKAKQTLDQAHIDTLRKLVDDFEGSYFGKLEHKHLKEDHGSTHK